MAVSFFLQKKIGKMFRSTLLGKLVRNLNEFRKKLEENFLWTFKKYYVQLSSDFPKRPMSIFANSSGGRKNISHLYRQLLGNFKWLGCLVEYLLGYTL